MVSDDVRRRWAEWVNAEIQGDVWRRRAAYNAAVKALSEGQSGADAATAAHTAANMQPNVIRCRLCGAYPAAGMTVYEHNGFVILMQFKNLKGPFCRCCGLYVWRRMTDTTLLRGWLGMFSFFIAPVTALVNVANLSKLTSLPPPQPGTAMQPPQNPEPGMFRRPGVYVYLGVVVFVLIAIIVPAIAARG